MKVIVFLGDIERFYLFLVVLMVKSKVLFLDTVFKSVNVFVLYDLFCYILNTCIGCFGSFFFNELTLVNLADGIVINISVVIHHSFFKFKITHKSHFLEPLDSYPSVISVIDFVWLRFVI